MTIQLKIADNPIIDAMPSYLDSLNKIASQVINDPRIAANAQIQFTTVSSTSPTLTEDAWGNPIPEESRTETICLDCWLQQKRIPPQDLQAGVDLNTSYFEGRLVEPKTYDFPLKATGPITVIVNDRKGFAVLELRKLESPSSQQHNIKSVLGEKIAVFVQFSQGN